MDEVKDERASEADSSAANLCCHSNMGLTHIDQGLISKNGLRLTLEPSFMIISGSLIMFDSHKLHPDCTCLVISSRVMQHKRGFSQEKPRTRREIQIFWKTRSRGC